MPRVQPESQEFCGMLDVSQRVAFFLELSHDFAVHGMVFVDDKCWVVAHLAQVLKCLHVHAIRGEI